MKTIIAFAVAATFGFSAFHTAAAAPSAAGAAAAEPAAQDGLRATAATVLYAQTSHASGTGHSSQIFEFRYAPDDDQLADDFTVPAGKTWTVSEIEAIGIYKLSTAGSKADSENVFLYKATAAGLPGLKIMQLNKVKGKDTNGTFAFTLPKPVILKAGTYFVSVQVNMNFETEGEWLWEVTAKGTKTLGSSALFRNPRNGLQSGCKTWKAVNSCVLDYYQAGSDVLFKILGTAN